MLPNALRRKAAVCRRLARLARQSDIAQALFELAEDFELAALDAEGEREQANRERPNKR